MNMQRYMRGMSNGGTITSARTGEPLTDDQLRRVVPSVFATEAHESRSHRFAPVPTIDILNGLRNEGFEPFYATQARTRIEGNAEFTKHMLRLRHRGLENDAGQAFEIILVNANDGTSAYQMIPGFFRFVCANGLIAGDTFSEVKVRHSGKAMDEVIEGAYEVLDSAPRVVEHSRAMREISLTRDEQIAYAEAAHQLRFPVKEGEQSADTPITAEMLLRPRRSEDRADDLWTTFNRVQENVLKGGLSARRAATEPGKRPRRYTMREVNGIDQNRSLNRALWTLSERMAELKGSPIAA